VHRRRVARTGRRLALDRNRLVGWDAEWLTAGLQ